MRKTFEIIILFTTALIVYICLFGNRSTDLYSREFFIDDNWYVDTKSEKGRKILEKKFGMAELEKSILEKCSKKLDGKSGDCENLIFTKKEPAKCIVKSVINEMEGIDRVYNPLTDKNDAYLKKYKNIPRVFKFKDRKTGKYIDTYTNLDNSRPGYPCRGTGKTCLVTPHDIESANKYAFLNYVQEKDIVTLKMKTEKIIDAYLKKIHVSEIVKQITIQKKIWLRNVTIFQKMKKEMY